MADDGGNGVATLRYAPNPHNQDMILEKFDIIAETNRDEEDEVYSHVCNFCDQVFTSANELQSHETNCGAQDLSSVKPQKSANGNRRSKAPPRKLSLEARCKLGELDETARALSDIELMNESDGNINKSASSSQYDDNKEDDVDEEEELANNPELVLAISQEQLDPNGTAVVDGPCYCDLCDKPFSGIFALKAHNYYYHSNVRHIYSCKLCPRQFKWEAILKRHVNIVHGGGRERRQNAATVVDNAQKSPLTHDQSSGETRAQLSANIEPTGEGDNYKCTTCSKVFGSLSAVRLHRFSAHGTGPRQVCKFCNKSFRPCHLARHCCWDKSGKRRRLPQPNNYVNNSEKTVKCELCNSSFENSNSLNEHLVSAHQDEHKFEQHSLSNGIENECSICHEVFDDAASLGMHQWRHHSLQKQFCSCCRKSYLASQFSSHRCEQYSASDNELNGNNNGGGSDVLQCANLSPIGPSASSKCDMCNRQYANDHSLKDHMRVVHGVYQRTTTTTTTASTTTAKKEAAAEVLHSDNSTPSSSSIGGARPSSSTNSAVAHGSNSNHHQQNYNGSSSNNSTALAQNNNTSPAQSDQCNSLPLRNNHRQASPPTSPPSTTDAKAASNDCVCMTCHRTFKNSSALRLHRFSAHGACPRRMCSKCNKAFLPWHYLRHACSGKSELSPTQQQRQPNAQQSIEWRCTMCERRYLSRRTLKDHLRIVHGVYQRRNLDAILPAVQTSSSKLDTANFEGQQNDTSGGVLDLSCPPGAKKMKVDTSDDNVEDNGLTSFEDSNTVLNLSSSTALKPLAKCGICFKQFKDLATLRKHRYTVHASCPKKMCPRCKKYFLPWHLKSHRCWLNSTTTANGDEPAQIQKIDEDSNLPKCHLCQRSYPDDQTLKCHLRVIHGVSDRPEEEETGDVQSPEKQPNSGKLPLNLNGNECGVCHKVFQSHGAARLHLFSAHGACPKRHCTSCNKWYLPWHYSRHFCQVTAQSTPNGNIQTGSEDSSATQTPEQTWKCEHCDRQYLSHRTLKDHLRIAHGIYQTKRPPSTAPESPTKEVQVKSVPSTPTSSSDQQKPNPGFTVVGDPASPMYECDICSKVFKSSSAARLHRLSGHGACPKKTCPNCQRTFLPCHYARHSCTAQLNNQQQSSPASNSEWKCHLCDRRYQSSRTLKDHLRIVHGVYQTRRNGEGEPIISESPLQPDERGNNSELQQLLSLNMAAESANINSASNIDEDGNRISATQSHINEDNECDICHKTFKNSSALRLHRYVTHVSRRRQLCSRCNKSFLPCHFPRHCCWSTNDSSAKNGEPPKKQVFASSEQTTEMSSTKCEICSMSFSSEASFKSHLETEHGIIEDMDSDETHCKDEMTVSEKNTDETAPEEEGDVESAPGSSNTPSNGFKCGICHLPFSNLTDVRKHRYSVHGACPKRVCPKCNKAILPCHFSRHTCEPNGSPTNEPVVSLKDEQVGANSFEKYELNDTIQSLHAVSEQKTSESEELIDDLKEEVTSEVHEDKTAQSSLMVFPGSDPFYDDFLAVKPQSAEGEVNSDELGFEDPLAVSFKKEPAPSSIDADATANSPQNSNNYTEQCQICNKVFKSSSALRLHRFSAHGTCPKKECPKCNKSFLPWHFTRHCCWNKDDEQQQQQQKDGESGESDGIASCDLCRRTYTSARTLKEHMRTVHGVYQRRNQPQQPTAQQQAQTTPVQQSPSSAAEEAQQQQQQSFNCPDCSATFSTPFEMLLHRLTHTGDKPFVCTECKDAFAMPQELEDHRKAVHQK